MWVAEEILLFVGHAKEKFSLRRQMLFVLSLQTLQGDSMMWYAFKWKAFEAHLGEKIGRIDLGRCLFGS